MIKKIKKNMQKIIWFSLDLIEKGLRIKNPMEPPRAKMNVGSNSFSRSDFNQIGESLFRLLREYGDVSSEDSVLDVGCGVGRMAIQFTKYLNEKGTYDGFDIISESIAHCQKEISSRYKQFQFKHINIFNTHYNPTGTLKASNLRFPYESDKFSFVFLTSVFTHMVKDDLENYLKEVSRVLKSGGTCLITYFLLNEESCKFLENKKTAIRFQFPAEKALLVDKFDPESAIAFEEPYILELYKSLGLNVITPIYYGNWCEGRAGNSGFQDMIIARKN